MKIRAHLFVGALVLLLGDMASAQINLTSEQLAALQFRRYLAYQAITRLNDDGIRAVTVAGETPGGGNFPMTVPLTGSNIIATLDRRVALIYAPSIKDYASSGLESWLEWKNAHRKTFGNFAYPKGGGEDGQCYLTAGTVLGPDRLKAWGRVSFNSWSGNNSDGQAGFRAYVKYAGVNANGPVTWNLYPGFDFRADGFFGQVQDIVNLQCFDADKFPILPYFYGDATYTDLPIFPNPLASLAAAMRPTYAAYLLMSPTPDLSGFAFSGYTEAQLNAPCNESTCPGLVPAGSGGGTTPPPTGGTGGTSTPPCTKPDGTASGNPYDCAPQNSDTKCGIIDIPCNLKKLFIPDKDFLKSKIEDGVGINVNIPLTVANKWETEITFAGQKFKVGADFSWFDWSEETKDQFNFYAFWGVFLFLLNYLGVPFLSSKRSADAARDATEGAAGRAAAESERINSEYQAMRADDSWKH